MGVLIAELAHVVAVRTEPDDSFLEQIQLHGSHLSDEHIDSHVPFDTPYQHRLADVLLNDRKLIKF